MIVLRLIKKLFLFYCYALGTLVFVIFVTVTCPDLYDRYATGHSAHGLPTDEPDSTDTIDRPGGRSRVK